MFWNIHRFVICGVIVLLLALINVSENIRNYHLGYKISKVEKELKVATEKKLQGTLAISNVKLHQNILARAESLGMEIKSPFVPRIILRSLITKQ